MVMILWRVYELTMLRAEKFRIGSSAASETELSMMNTKMRLVNMWWLMSLWQNTRTLEGKGNTTPVWQQTRRVSCSVHYVMYMSLTGLCCWRWRRRFPLGWEWSFPSLPAQRWPAEAPMEPLGLPHLLHYHRCPLPPPYYTAKVMKCISDER